VTHFTAPVRASSAANRAPSASAPLPSGHCTGTMMAGMPLSSIAPTASSSTLLRVLIKHWSWGGGSAMPEAQRRLPSVPLSTAMRVVPNPGPPLRSTITSGLPSPSTSTTRRLSADESPTIPDLLIHLTTGWKVLPIDAGAW
jgi:hypothetical protein